MYIVDFKYGVGHYTPSSGGFVISSAPLSVMSSMPGWLDPIHLSYFKYYSIENKMQLSRVLGHDEGSIVIFKHRIPLLVEVEQPPGGIVIIAA